MNFKIHTSHSFKYFHKSELQEPKWPRLQETRTQTLHVLGQKVYIRVSDTFA